MAVETYQGTLVVLDCANCGMTFGVTKRFDQDRRDDHASFYCPKRCTNYYPQKSEAEKLQEQLEREKRLSTARLADVDRARAEADHQAAVARGYKGALVKSKKRAAKGVCPVAGCKRHFADVERHIAAKHPDYVAAEA